MAARKAHLGFLACCGLAEEVPRAARVRRFCGGLVPRACRFIDDSAKARFFAVERPVRPDVAPRGPPRWLASDVIYARALLPRVCRYMGCLRYVNASVAEGRDTKELIRLAIGRHESPLRAAVPSRHDQSR
jgi:hypothetical protein